MTEEKINKIQRLIEEENWRIEEVAEEVNVTIEKLKKVIYSKDLDYYNRKNQRIKKATLKKLVKKHSSCKDIGEELNQRPGWVKREIRRHGLNFEDQKKYKRQKRIEEKLDDEDIMRTIKKEMELSHKQLNEMTGVSTNYIKKLTDRHDINKFNSEINPLHLAILYYVLEINMTEIAELLGMSQAEVGRTMKDYGFFDVRDMVDLKKLVEDKEKILGDMSGDDYAEKYFQEPEESFDRYIRKIRYKIYNLISKSQR